MNAVENQVRKLVKVELSVANEQFPQFHSQHEGYAVILEELQETKEQVDDTERHLGYAWNIIRDNIPAEKMIEAVGDCAVRTAVEAIQVAAMCQKFLEMHEPAK